MKELYQQYAPYNNLTSYLIIAAVCYLAQMIWLAWYSGKHETSGESIVGWILGHCFTSITWPIYIPALLVFYFFTRIHNIGKAQARKARLEELIVFRIGVVRDEENPQRKAHHQKILDELILQHEQKQW